MRRERPKIRKKEIENFIRYVHVGGSVYELDGRRGGAIKVGDADAQNWQRLVQPVIQGRLLMCASIKIRTRLLAFVGDGD